MVTPGRITTERFQHGESVRWGIDYPWTGTPEEVMERITEEVLQALKAISDPIPTDEDGDAHRGR